MSISPRILFTSGGAAAAPNAGNLCGDLLTPTITHAGWDYAPPTNLQNLYDGDRSTFGGDGVDTSPPAAETNGDDEIKIDLGALYYVHSIYAKIGFRSTGVGATVWVVARSGDLGDLTDESLGSASTAGVVFVTEHILWTRPNAFGTAEQFTRYIAFRMYRTAGVGGTSLRIYEVIVIGDKRAAG